LGGRPVVNDPARGGDPNSKPAVRLYKKDFWREENLKYLNPHFRMQRAAWIIERLARGRKCDLLDVGCGPATLEKLVSPNINYYGIDIAIHEPAPNLIEIDFMEKPIGFGDKKFDIVIAQGVFEYVGDSQEQKFAEISQLLSKNGLFVVSYVNFGHRGKNIYWPYSNIEPMAEFRASLASHFTIGASYPSSHNWNHNEPNRKLVQALQRHLNINIPFISPRLAIEYFFVCSLP
jgi:SAM-dependent methyltransferase